MEATSQSLPRVFRTGSSTDGRSVSPALSALLPSLLPSSSWNGLLTTDSVSAAAAIYPSRFLFEPKMSNDSSRRRRRLFPLAFQHFSRPHRLNLRERATGSVFVLRRPIDALPHTLVLKCACLLPTSNSSPSSRRGTCSPIAPVPTPHSHRGQGQIAISTFASAALKEGETRTREER